MNEIKPGTIINGDALTVLREMDDEVIDFTGGHFEPLAVVGLQPKSQDEKQQGEPNQDTCSVFVFSRIYAASDSND